MKQIWWDFKHKKGRRLALNNIQFQLTKNNTSFIKVVLLKQGWIHYYKLYLYYKWSERSWIFHPSSLELFQLPNHQVLKMLLCTTRKQCRFSRDISPIAKSEPLCGMSIEPRALLKPSEANFLRQLRVNNNCRRLAMTFLSQFPTNLRNKIISKFVRHAIGTRKTIADEKSFLS